MKQNLLKNKTVTVAVHKNKKKLEHFIEVCYSYAIIMRNARKVFSNRSDTCRERRPSAESFLMSRRRMNFAPEQYGGNDSIP